jgi:membrane protein implicated in regulation of membrane protease activity
VPKAITEIALRNNILDARRESGMYHITLLMPVFALVVFWIFPLSTAGLIYATIAALSIWMYVLIWRAMRRPIRAGAEELLNSVGEVMEVQGNSLRVRVHSEMWNAESKDTLQLGDRVKVVSITGLILRVRRFDDSEGNNTKHMT